VNVAFEGCFQVDLQVVSRKSNLAAVAGEGLQGGRKSKVKAKEIPFWVFLGFIQGI